MKQTLCEDDFEYVLVTQLPSPPPQLIKKKGLTLRILALLLTFSLKRSLGLN